jgi:uncharacterized protein YjeT (DUF2065 family)
VEVFLVMPTAWQRLASIPTDVDTRRQTVEVFLVLPTAWQRMATIATDYYDCNGWLRSHVYDRTVDCF